MYKDNFVNIKLEDRFERKQLNQLQKAENKTFEY